VALTLYWHAVGRLEDSYTVFVHIVGANGVVAQRDSIPIDGTLPTTLWKPDQTVIDPYRIVLPPDLPAGPYRIEVGVHRSPDTKRLPATDAAGRRLDEDRVVLSQGIEVR
jgi:hypothetical protein